MAERTRILFITLDVPSPAATGAAVRTYHFLRQLCSECIVDLLVPQKVEVGARRSLEALCRRVISADQSGIARSSIWVDSAKSIARPFRDGLLPLKSCLERIRWSVRNGTNSLPSRISLILLEKLLSSLLLLGRKFSLESPIICEQYFSGLKECLRTHSCYGGEAFHYDLLWFEHTSAFPLASIAQKSVRAKRLVCNSHNVEYLLARQIDKLADRGDSRNAPQSATIKRCEKLCLSVASAVFACSVADKEQFSRLHAQANVIVAPNGVDLAYFSPRRNNADGRTTLIFTGAMSYLPNLDGVLYFVKEVLPLIRRAESGVRLIVAGRSADILKDMLPPDSSIEIVGDPLDIRPYFNRATVAVVPLRSGGGTRLKIVEAMAMEVPVVSTSVGAEGVSYRPGVELRIADSPSDFASAVLALLSSPTERERQVIAAKKFVEGGFDWSTIASRAISQLWSLGFK